MKKVKEVWLAPDSGSWCTDIMALTSGPPNPTGAHIWKASPLPLNHRLSHNMAKKLEGKGHLNRCPLVRQSMKIERVQSCSFVILFMGNHRVLQEYINPWRAMSTDLVYQSPLFKNPPPLNNITQRSSLHDKDY